MEINIEEKVNMKRLFIVLISFLAVSINSFAQEIQTRFLGLTMGEEYTFNARESRIGEYIFEKKEKGKYLGTDIRFGGCNWDFVWISLFNKHNTPNQGKFYQIEFECYFEDEQEAKDMANALHDSLSSKYGDGEFEKKENDRYGTAKWYGSNNMTCRLSISYSKSKGGDMYYYVDLFYCDIALFLEQGASEYDEL